LRERSEDLGNLVIGPPDELSFSKRVRFFLAQENWNVRPLTQVLSAASVGRFSETVLPSPVTNSRSPLVLVNLTLLMELSSGRAETTIALIDGPVATDHKDLSSTNIREIPGRLRGTCARANSVACMHGTFVAGILSAKRGSHAPSISPGCTLLVRPIFAEPSSGNRDMPSATPEDLATAIIDCVDAGANVINLSAAIVQPSAKGERRLAEALDYSAKRGTVIVAAAGNQGSVGSSAITRHHWVIPVVACDLRGRPIGYSNFGNAIGRRGLSAPGDGITSLGADGELPTFGGTSAAAPFVTGAIALLMSIFPHATATELRLGVTRGQALRRSTVVPPLLDAWAAYQVMATTHARRRLT
jgi:subtilisin family serine protease